MSNDAVALIREMREALEENDAAMLEANGEEPIYGALIAKADAFLADAERIKG